MSATEAMETMHTRAGLQCIPVLMQSQVEFTYKSRQRSVKSVFFSIIEWVGSSIIEWAGSPLKTISKI